MNDEATKGSGPGCGTIAGAVLIGGLFLGVVGGFIASQVWSDGGGGDDSPYYGGMARQVCDLVRDGATPYVVIRSVDLDSFGEPESAELAGYLHEWIGTDCSGATEGVAGWDAMFRTSGLSPNP